MAKKLHKCKTFIHRDKPQPLYCLIVNKSQEDKEIEQYIQKEMEYWEDKADMMIEAMIDDRHFK